MVPCHQAGSRRVTLEEAWVPLSCSHRAVDPQGACALHSSHWLENCTVPGASPACVHGKDRLRQAQGKL